MKVSHGEDCYFAGFPRGNAVKTVLLVVFSMKPTPRHQLILNLCRFLVVISASETVASGKAAFWEGRTTLYMGVGGSGKLQNRRGTLIKKDFIFILI
jgi:hypothetical protein